MLSAHNDFSLMRGYLFRRVKQDHLEEPKLPWARISEDYQESCTPSLHESFRIHEMDERRGKELDACFWLERILRTKDSGGLPEWVVLLGACTLEWRSLDYEMKALLRKYLETKHSLTIETKDRFTKKHHKDFKVLTVRRIVSMSPYHGDEAFKGDMECQ